MEPSEFTLRIILLFIPGIIAFLIIDRLSAQEETRIHNILAYSLVLGFTSYSLYFLLVKILNSILCISIKFIFFDALTDRKITIDFLEIIIVSTLAIFLGYFVAFCVERKLLYKVAQMLRISNIIGGTDVFSHLLNKEEIVWIRVRDAKNDLIYEGKVDDFSESADFEEIYISDVTVYDSAQNIVDHLSGLYLNRKTTDLVIEIPELEAEHNEKGENNGNTKEGNKKEGNKKEDNKN
jgi:hypothetical protein